MRRPEEEQARAEHDDQLPDLYDQEGDPIFVSGTETVLTPEEREALLKSVGKMQSLRKHLKKGATPEKG